MNSKIVIALDTEISLAKKIVNKSLKYGFNIFKIGHIIFDIKPEFIKYITSLNGKVILDLKFHDIPSVIKKATSIVVKKYKIFGLTIHLSGGEEMVKGVKDVVDQESPETKVFGVTVLTSMSDSDLIKLGFKNKVQELVFKLAKVGKSCGIDGIVCSPNEVKKIKSSFGKNFLTLVPGVWIGDEVKEQKRGTSLDKVILSGADYIVLGRTLYESEHIEKKLEIVNSILKNFT